MSRLIAILLIEVVIAYFVLAPICILRHDQVRAFAAWHDNPTPETKAELDRQKRITELDRLGFSAVVFGMMAGITLLAAWIWRHRRTIPEALTNDTPAAQPGAAANGGASTPPGNSRVAQEPPSER